MRYFFCALDVGLHARRVLAHCTLCIFIPLNPRFRLFLARFLVVNYIAFICDLCVTPMTALQCTALLVFIGCVFSALFAIHIMR